MKPYVKSAILVLVLATIVFSILIAAKISNTGKEAQNVAKADEKKQLSFKTYTSAVCEQKGEFTVCKDEFFVNCNGTVFKAKDAAQCEGMKIGAPEAMGFAVLDKDWKDPRK